MEKAKGAYIRSRAKWIEEGERNSAYFCRLEKSRQEKNNIRSLIIDGSESSNANDIAQKKSFSSITYISRHFLTLMQMLFLIALSHLFHKSVWSLKRFVMQKFHYRN